MRVQNRHHSPAFTPSQRAKFQKKNNGKGSCGVRELGVWGWGAAVQLLQMLIEFSF